MHHSHLAELHLEPEPYDEKLKIWDLVIVQSASKVSDGSIMFTRCNCYRLVIMTIIIRLHDSLRLNDIDYLLTDLLP